MGGPLVNVLKRLRYLAAYRPGQDAKSSVMVNRLDLARLLQEYDETDGRLRRVNQEQDEIVRTMPAEPVYMDPPDGGDVPLAEQFRRMAEDARRYRQLRAMHWHDSPLCVIVPTMRDPNGWPRRVLPLGVDCPSEARLDEMLDGLSQSRGYKIKGQSYD